MTTPVRNPLLAHEDWWAIWLGALLMAVVVAQLVTSVPGVGRWTSSPGRSLGAVDKRADIWSFGVVLFEMLTGQRMFTGETVSQAPEGWGHRRSVSNPRHRSTIP